MHTAHVLTCIYVLKFHQGGGLFKRATNNNASRASATNITSAGKIKHDP